MFIRILREPFQRCQNGQGKVTKRKNTSLYQHNPPKNIHPIKQQKAAEEGSGRKRVAKTEHKQSSSSTMYIAQETVQSEHFVNDFVFITHEDEYEIIWIFAFKWTKDKEAVKLSFLQWK